MSPSRFARLDRVAVALGVVGVLAAVESIRLGLGGPRTPGPGLAPFIAAVVLVVACAGLVRGSPAPTTARDAKLSRNRIAVAVLLVGCALAMETAGYRVTIAVTLAVLLRILGVGGWSAALPVGVLAALASHALVARLLGVPLPKGILGI